MATIMKNRQIGLRLEIDWMPLKPLFSDQYSLSQALQAQAVTGI